MLQLSDFQTLVLEDAEEVQNREETDTIDIIDNIRFHLTNFLKTYSEMDDARNYSLMLDEYLVSIGLDC